MLGRPANHLCLRITARAKTQTKINRRVGPRFEAKDARMRTDPIRMAKLDLLGQYLDYQGQTMLLRTDGLSGEPLTQKRSPRNSPSAGCSTTGHWWGGCSALRLDR